MNTTVIAEFPALKVIAPQPWEKFRHGDIIALPRETLNHGTLWYQFKLGTIFGYAVQYGDDPLKAYEDAKAKGHDLYWANACAIVLHNGPKRQEVVTGLNYGDVITLEGHKFRLEKAPNDNIKLVEVEG